MEIIYQGTPPEDVDHCITCEACQSQLRFKRSEAEFVADYRLLGTKCRKGTALKINCPVCNQTLWKYDP